MELELVDITGYEGLYQINKAGQVWSVKSKKFLKSDPSKNGYCVVTLHNKESRQMAYSIHRLLALQFLPNPLGLSFVDHIDINPSNNNLENLRWISRRGNNLNRTNKPKSGEQNIRVRENNTFQVQIKLGKKCHYKTFKTIDEAKTYRDNFVRENNL